MEYHLHTILISFKSLILTLLLLMFEFMVLCADITGVVFRKKWTIVARTAAAPFRLCLPQKKSLSFARRTFFHLLYYICVLRDAKDGIFFVMDLL